MRLFRSEPPTTPGGAKVSLLPSFQCQWTHEVWHGISSFQQQQQQKHSIVTCCCLLKKEAGADAAGRKEGDEMGSGPRFPTPHSRLSGRPKHALRLTTPPTTTTAKKETVEAEYWSWSAVGFHQICDAANKQAQQVSIIVIHSLLFAYFTSLCFLSQARKVRSEKRSFSLHEIITLGHNNRHQLTSSIRSSVEIYYHRAY
jgi:hypothetical protein